MGFLDNFDNFTIDFIYALFPESFTKMYDILWIHYYSLVNNYSLFSWVKVNHKFKYSTNYKFSISVYVDFGKTTKRQYFLNPRKLVPTKLNEFTVAVFFFLIGNLVFVNFKVKF